MLAMTAVVLAPGLLFGQSELAVHAAMRELELRTCS
jgi:hypothetical protein